MNNNEIINPINSMKQIVDFLNKDFSGIVNKNFINPYRNIQETIKSIKNLSNVYQSKDFYNILNTEFIDPFKNIREAINPVSRYYSESIKRIRATDFINIANKEFINPIKNIREMINLLNRDYSSSISEISNLFQNLESIKWDTINTALEEYNFDKCETEEEFIKLSININLVISKEPQSLLSLEFYLNLLITLIIVVHTQKLATDSENRIVSNLNEGKQYIVEQFDKIIEENSKQNNNIGIFYVVTRTVYLRSKSNTKSTPVTILYPNQKTRLVKRKGKWIHIEYFNHLLGIHQSGWCNKKYLKKFD